MTENRTSNIESDSSELLAEDIENLKHMLGATPNNKKRDWGYRNYFAAGSSDIQSMERMVGLGLVLRGRPYEDHSYYHATRKGAIAAGLHKAAIKRAFGG